MNRRLLIFLGFLLLIVHPHVFAAPGQQAGKTILSQGDVTAVRSTGSVKLQRRSSIYTFDEIHVGKDSAAQFRMQDGALIALSENSVLKVDAYRYSGNATQDSVLLKLITGSFRTITGAVGKADAGAYKVETPLATIGIRGTDYELDLDQDGLVVAVWKGAIRLTSAVAGGDGCDATLGSGGDFQFASVSPAGFCEFFEADPGSRQASSKRAAQPGNAVTASPGGIDSPTVAGLRESALAVDDRPGDDGPGDDGPGDNGPGHPDHPGLPDLPDFPGVPNLPGHPGLPDLPQYPLGITK